MVQSTITAWLKKPATVAKPDESIPAPPASTNNDPDPPLITNNFSLPPLPPNVQLVPLTEDLMPGFQRLTALTLPVSYPPAFFAESMTEPIHSITLMATWQTAPLSPEPTLNLEKPRVVGAIRCRLLPSSTLYISTISLLAPYRSHGIASHLLQNVIVKASNAHGVRSITAHVWEANEDGLEWYEKRGFEIIGKEDKYYNKLKPSGAVLVRKWVEVSDLLPSADKNGPGTT
ncbi:acyl-CoA N-acyltransferase [Periconia macrospinosa]|uniref:Acyl-CoA N-acyltransferase n=1 Tax=Periconia macrospinosa TaxID=97972 RepID=A0A2V1EC01_9PLEO|nr:acyl-CoA N-acyltransferase [Periconia macrospinosa]